MSKQKLFGIGFVLSSLCITLQLCIFDCEAGIRVTEESSDEKYFPSDFNQDNNLENSKIPSDQTLILRLPSNALLKYTSYKDVSILHFRIPQDTRTALFTFKAFEESRSVFRGTCEPQSVTLHLKASSYPIISPENITFPKNFLDEDQRLKIYDLDMKSDEKERHISIDGPRFGNWFAVAFISWTDPNNDRIEQHGLTAACDTLLFAEMSVVQFKALIINTNQRIVNVLKTHGKFRNSTFQQHENGTDEVIYKFFAPFNVGRATISLNTLTECSNCPKLGLSIKSEILPSFASDDKSNIRKIMMDVTKIRNNTINLNTRPNNWHYVRLKFINENSTAKFPNIYADEQLLNFSIHLEFHNEEQNSRSSKNTNINKFSKSYNLRNIEMFPLLRQTYREFFMFDYDLLPDENGTVPILLNLTAGTTVGFEFDIGEVYDIGGTLSFALNIKNDKKDSENIKLMPVVPSSSENNILMVAEKLIWSNDSSNHLSQNKTYDNKITNQTIIICMHLGEPGTPTWPDKCLYGNRFYTATAIVNNTDYSTSTGIIHVPYPESGTWFLTMGLFCHGADTTPHATIIDNVKEFVRKHASYLQNMKSPCTCANKTELLQSCIKDWRCFSNMRETEILKFKECLMDSKCTPYYREMTQKFNVQHKQDTEQHLSDAENCNASVIFSIASSACVSGRCGRFGRCFHYMSGGFVFSTCVCTKGYRGWDCSEDSQVPSNISLIMGSLLLTLSNLLFLPSIYISIRRNYYTEGVIYFFAMFFSIFYHSCDSGEDEYSFCLVRMGVLQFCDFYCGLLAIWVTLVAMSNVRQQFVSLLHMFGAITLAFGTELDKQSLWVFLAPALTGICIISVSWGLRCHKSKKIFPSIEYLTIYLPIGAVLVITGLVCYALLQTKQNYHIVHSIWHMVMALSLLCLLPSNSSFKGNL